MVLLLTKPRERLIQLETGQIIVEIEEDDSDDSCASSDSLDEEREMVGILASHHITIDNPTDKLENIDGLEEQINQINPIIYGSTEYPNLVYPESSSIGGDHSLYSFLLYGYPAARKYELIRALAGENGNTLFYVCISKLLPKWENGSQIHSLMEALFTLAKLRKPSIIYIDNFELLSKGTKDPTSFSAVDRANICYRSGFIRKFNHAPPDYFKQVILVGATSKPGLIDDSLLLRFTFLVRIPTPPSITCDLKYTQEIEHFYRLYDSHAEKDSQSIQENPPSIFQILLDCFLTCFN